MQNESRSEARAWAREEFGHAELGDPRRTARLVRMATSLAESPGGKIVEVFRSNAEQQGAYDLLANQRVHSDALLAAVRARQRSGVWGSHGFMWWWMEPACELWIGNEPRASAASVPR